MAITSKTILFVTGSFVTNRGWEPWQRYFEEKGYATHAPAWPHKDGDPATLRAQHPHSPIASVRLKQVVEKYASFARSLPEKPILIGHSAGGLMTQLLLVNHDVGVAGVAIHPAPPMGVLPIELSFYRAALGAFGIFTSLNTSYLMPFETWQYAFTNEMSIAEQKKTYDENVIPESKRFSWDCLSLAGRVYFKKQHAPLLITSGDKDNILPASLNYRNFKKYPQGEGSVTEYKEFKGRNHFVLGQPTWKEDANYILEWLARN